MKKYKEKFYCEFDQIDSQMGGGQSSEVELPVAAV